MKKSKLIFFLMFTAALPAFAQKTGMFIPRDIKKAYDNRTRTLEGKPGPNYWQNSSDYKMSVRLDPEKLILNGSEIITYKNNSPNKLNVLYIRLYHDILKKEASRTRTANPDILTNGVAIKKLMINGEAVELDPSKPFTAGRNGTNIRITLKNPIETKTNAKIEVDWSIPIVNNNRFMMDMYSPTTFFMAYFYPQIAVYDDLNGWDSHEHKGTVEFYNDFNNYDVNITVPAKYAVWATGVLQNGKENYTKEIWGRVEDAKVSEKPVNIIKKEDIEKSNVIRNNVETIWHYIAENVTDFAFAAGSEMIWDASTIKLPDGRETFVSSIYQKDTKHGEEIVNYARNAIEYFSSMLPGVPYPFPCMTTFSRPGDGGTELPMMTNDGISDDKMANVVVTVHEIAHSYMPFYVGTNERKYAWMDEGWAVMFTYDGVENQLTGIDKRNGDSMQLSNILGNEEELPPMTPSEILAGGEGATYTTASYPRPGIAFNFLRNLLGDDLFKKALREFMERWHGKHPIPHDFFYTFNQVAGEDLNWFWEPWFFERGYADLAIKDVTVYDAIYKTTIQRDGILPVPIKLKYIYEDGTSDEVTRPVTVWKGGIKECVVEFKPAKKVDKIELGANSIPDVNKANNKFNFNLGK